MATACIDAEPMSSVEWAWHLLDRPTAAIAEDVGVSKDQALRIKAVVADLLWQVVTE